jgi:hypothetical protein
MIFREDFGGLGKTELQCKSLFQKGINGFQDRRIKPLCHPSKALLINYL